MNNKLKRIAKISNTISIAVIALSIVTLLILGISINEKKHKDTIETTVQLYLDNATTTKETTTKETTTKETTTKETTTKETTTKETTTKETTTKETTTKETTTKETTTKETTTKEKENNMKEENNLTAYQNYIYKVVKQVCSKYKSIDPTLVMGIISVESDFNKYCDNGNCKGLMQVYVAYHRDRMSRLGVTDIFDEYQNILVGVDILNEYYEMCNKDMTFALMAYNLGYGSAKSKYSNGQVTKYPYKVYDRQLYFKQQLGDE